MEEDDLTHHPIAIIEDRYGGAYSGGEWLAISQAYIEHSNKTTRASYCLQDGPSGDDVSAMNFWSDKPDWITAGSSPDKALAELRERPTQ